MTREKIIWILLYMGAIVSGALCVYRLLMVVRFIHITSAVVLLDNASLIAFLAAMTFWCWQLGSFKQDPCDFLSFYSEMKVLSFFASVACFVHFASSLAYFFQMLTGKNLVTDIYVGGELVMWLILGAFFLFYAFSNKKIADELHDKVREEGGIYI